MTPRGTASLNRTPGRMCSCTSPRSAWKASRRSPRARKSSSKSAPAKRGFTPRTSLESDVGRLHERTTLHPPASNGGRCCFWPGRSPPPALTPPFAAGIVARPRASDLSSNPARPTRNRSRRRPLLLPCPAFRAFASSLSSPLSRRWLRADLSRVLRAHLTPAHHGPRREHVGGVGHRQLPPPSARDPQARLPRLGPRLGA